MEILKPKDEKSLFEPIIITTFYSFTKIKEGIHLFKDKIEYLCNTLNATGTLLISEEGINGTLSFPEENIEKFYTFFTDYIEFKDIIFKESYYKVHPFGKLKIKIKKEVVSSGCKVDYNPGIYIEPSKWDEFISDKEVILIDVRNNFEYIIGTFKGAINPETENFRDFKRWCENNLVDKSRKIGQFCTGGIRCEKSTSWLKSIGYENVYHLKGGVIGYFIETENKNGFWKGDCFVFDDRIIINEKLK